MAVLARWLGASRPEPVGRFGLRGNFWRRLVLPRRIDSWPLTRLQQKVERQLCTARNNHLKGLLMIEMKVP